MAVKKAKISKAKKKPVKKPVKKNTVSKPAKKVTKQITALKKGLKKEVALTKNVSKKTSVNTKELEVLKREIEALKKKKKRAGLSDYNRFMRAQIKNGLTFKQAAALWRKNKNALAKKSKKRTAYNIFVSMQLKQGKTMKQAIAAWNRLKNPLKKRKRPVKKAIAKPKLEKKVKPVKKRAKPKRKAKAKPKRKAKAVKKTVKRKTVRKKVVKRVVKSRPRVKRVTKFKRTVRSPIVAPREVFPAEKVAALVNEALKKMQVHENERIKTVKKIVSETKVIGQMLCGEEIALKMLDVYFTEVARYTLKRSLTLDEVINEYFYTLARVERKGIELNEIEAIINRGKA